MSCHVENGRSDHINFDSAVLTDVECEFSYRVSLMEALESMEANGDYVIAVIEESEMRDDQLLARLSLALQVSGSKKKKRTITANDFALITLHTLYSRSIIQRTSHQIHRILALGEIGYFFRIL